MKKFIIIFSVVVTLASSYSQNKNISEGNIFDGEPYLAINPLNSQHFVVAWIGYIDSTRAWIKTRVSFDAGETWSGINLIGHSNPFYGSADPSLDFNSEGDVYLSYIDFNKFLFSGADYVRKSTDGGLTWEDPVEVINVNSDPGKFPIDRPWISIDRSGGNYNGNIYVTTMNPTIFGFLPPPYHPYLTVSSNGGSSFGDWRYLDTLNWLAGNLIRSPMPMPAVSSDGTFHAVYVSFLYSQNPDVQYIIASSSDGGNSFTYHPVFTTPFQIEDSLAKKGYLLQADPSDVNHLAFFSVNNLYGDLDIFMRESYDKGAIWSGAERVNDDPVGNNRMQDLLWADFNNDGDLAVSWRDRRNGNDSTYTTSYEIWGAVRLKDSGSFSDNFRISDTLIAYDSILANPGNDFMCIKLVNDTLNAVWGDTRDGHLNIWFQRTAISDVVSSVDPSSKDKTGTPDKFFVYQNYPNPFNPVTTISYSIPQSGLVQLKIFDMLGREVAILLNKVQSAGNHEIKFDASDFTSGVYFYRLQSGSFSETKKLVLLR
ncbi:hypothetical protein BMS3Abin03_02680 [bacterium BMS3Abin03]|nr:hypothetical protein BMS3Abin03_02680 [bacterium BMS3Abin03]